MCCRFQERLHSRDITRFTSLAVSRREKVIDWALDVFKRKEMAWDQVEACSRSRFMVTSIILIYIHHCQPKWYYRRNKPNYTKVYIIWFDVVNLNWMLRTHPQIGVFGAKSRTINVPLCGTTRFKGHKNTKTLVRLSIVLQSPNPKWLETCMQTNGYQIYGFRATVCKK